MKVVMACGGTGGHIYPAIAIAGEIRKRDKKAEIFFIGSDNGMEKKIVKKEGFGYAGIPARPFVRKITAANMANFLSVIRAVFTAGKILRGISPDYVIGTGGFVSFPVIYAASKMGMNTAIHEPNMVPGLANKWLKRKAGVITVGFEETAAYFPREKTRVTGNPIREVMKKNSRKKALRMFGLSARKKTVLIMPGSRAARRINDVFIDALCGFKSGFKNVQLLWMCGRDDYKRVVSAVKKEKAAAKVLPFIHDAGAAYAACDAAVLRAGASTLSEIAALKVPSILVPYPYAAGKHQDKNALVFALKKAAIVINDRDLEKEVLLSSLKKVLRPKIKARMKAGLKKIYRGNGARNIVDSVTGGSV